MAIGVIAAAWILLQLFFAGNPLGGDARGYWYIDRAAPYAAGTGVLDAPVAFEFAPPILLVAEALHVLPWPLFLGLWLSLLCLVLVWLARGWTPLVAALPPVALELWYGNVNLLLAAVVVIGFRWPAVWSFALLTKVTPGIGLLWFAVRREWRSLGFAAGATVALALASFALAPQLWPQWLALLAADANADASGSIRVPLVVRLPAAAALIVLAAIRNWRWLMPVAVALALPVLWPAGLSVMVGTLPLVREARQRRAGSAGGAQGTTRQVATRTGGAIEST